MKVTSTPFIALACSLYLLSSFTHASEQATLSEVDGKRELRNGRGGKGGGGGGGKGGSAKGGSSKGGSSKGGSSKGSSSGSGKGSSSGSGKGGGDGGVCDQCNNKQCLAAINLQGFEFPFTVIPASNGEKVGSTTTTFQQAVIGTAQYDDQDIDINATITGSCTILSTSVPEPTPNAIDRCLLHCTFCVTYAGEYCEAYGYNRGRALWGEETSYEEDCCEILGFATLTGDLVLDIQLNEAGEIDDPAAQFTDFFGQFAVTGTAYDLTGAVDGGIALIEFQDFSPLSYKFDIKVPFSDECACKVSDSAYYYLYG